MSKLWLLAGVRTIAGVQDRDASALVETSRNGPFPFEALVDPIAGKRGSQVEIGLSCEGCPAAFVVGLQFHKGSVFVRWKVLGDAEELGVGETWRD